MGLPEKRRRMHKVPENIREQSIQLFNPTIVSLGPYHHGKPELSRVESFKNDCLDSCTGGHVPRRTELYNVILQHIVEIKSCYADEVETFAKFADDKAVALMMLLDTCFIINFMANSLFWPGPNAQLEQININIPDNNDNRVANNTEDWIDFFGLTTSIQSVSTDIFLLENQVPFLAIRLLMDLLYDPETRTQLLERFIGWVISVDQNTRLKIPRAGQEAPIHLLEAFWRVLAIQISRKKKIAQIQSPLSSLAYSTGAPYQSVSNLKAEGVKIYKTDSPCLWDIKFRPGFILGRLYIPCRQVSYMSPIVFSNLIAYETSPSTRTENVVLCYVNMMKSLIQTPEDVKILQTKGVLLNKFADDEQAVQSFKEINTCGFPRFDTFRDIRQGIEKHCQKKRKKWLSILYYKWIAGFFFLLLAAVRTYFTVFPP
ncbi:hypothetical protein ACS0TY_001054 [Phlomoides rotata]